MMGVHQGQIFMDGTAAWDLSGASLFVLGNDNVAVVSDIPDLRFDPWIPYNFWKRDDQINIGRI